MPICLADRCFGLSLLCESFVSGGFVQQALMSDIPGMGIKLANRCLGPSHAYHHGRVFGIGPRLVLHASDDAFGQFQFAFQVRQVGRLLLLCGGTSRQPLLVIGQLNPVSICLRCQRFQLLPSLSKLSCFGFQRFGDGVQLRPNVGQLLIRFVTSRTVFGGHD